jgi:hypothetical protein
MAIKTGSGRAARRAEAQTPSMESNNTIAVITGLLVVNTI